MIHHLRSRSWLLVAPILMTTLSGCGIWDAWRYRMSDQQQPSRTAYNYGNAYRVPTQIQPGHSTDADQFNDGYSPHPEEHPLTPENVEPLAPPPAPPARSNVPSSKPDQPLIEQDVKLRKSPQPGNKLIKTLKTPGLFTPEGVRSIYDRFRNKPGSEAAPLAEKPTGPVAQNRVSESPTRACRYTEAASFSGGPVQLGLPETEPLPQTDEQRPLHDDEYQRQTRPSDVMQASPSSFKHPLLADPTGMPYGIR